MKIYHHLNLSGLENSYIVANEKNHEAILIDPGQTSEGIIEQIENNSLKLTTVLITHNHKNHVAGLKTLMKIYSPFIYAVDWEIEGNETVVLNGEGKIRLAGMTVHYMAIPGHTADSMVYKIGNVLFTGDTIGAGLIGNTNSNNSFHILSQNIVEKILSQQENTVIMPGHGPPTSVGAERLFNKDLGETIYNNPNF